MLRKYSATTLFFSLLVFFVAASSDAQGPFQLHQEITKMVPLFAEGHQGDLAHIVGFEMESDITLDGQLVGQSTFSIELDNPPFNMAVKFATARMVGRVDFPGIGAFTFTGDSSVMTNTMTPINGALNYCWTGQFDNGEGALAGLTALAGGAGTSNFFLRTGGDDYVMVLTPK